MGVPVSAPFVHLHCHSEYSILDGACRIKELVKRAVELEMPAVTVTDHGSMAGAVELYRNATKAGIKPIVGCEVYLVDDRFQKEAARRALVGAPDAAGRGHRRVPQPRQARHDRLPRGLPLQAARRLRPAAAVLRRADRAHRLPVGPRLQGAAGRRPAARAGRARPAGADLRPRPGLHRDPGRRHRRAPPGQPGPARSWPTRPACPPSARATSTTCAPRTPIRTRRCSASRRATSCRTRSGSGSRTSSSSSRRPTRWVATSRRTAASCCGRRSRSPSAATSRSSSARSGCRASTCRAARTAFAYLTRLCEAGLAERYGAITPELQNAARSSSCRPSARWASPTTS